MAEFFGIIILVNGKAWPKLVVEPRKYRFRLLNGSDSRFYILKLDNDADIMIIGSDDGLLEKPVNTKELLFAPGERYDVVIDFKGLTGNITMLNLGPDKPYGGGVPGVDFTSSCTKTTGQIMQFQVTKPLSDVPDALVDENSTLNTIAWKSPDNAGSPRQLVLFEGRDEYGRLQPMLGTMANGSQTWSELISENPTNNTTEIWEVYNATGDAHPIHLHLVKFQILNREEFTSYEDELRGIEDKVLARPQMQHNNTFGIGGDFFLHPDEPLVPGTQSYPEDYEKGWKDTFIVPPGQVGRLVAHFDRPGRYVWHCHILFHEDHEMMRPFHVGPIPVMAAAGFKGAAGDDTSGGQEIENKSLQDSNMKLAQFALYPNPAADMVYINFNLDRHSDVSLKLYGMDGRMILSEELGAMPEGSHSYNLSLDRQDEGLYVLELNVGSKVYREKFFISR